MVSTVAVNTVTSYTRERSKGIGYIKLRDRKIVSLTSLNGQLSD